MDINITKTKEYYAAIEGSLLCDCSYCRCYREQVKTVYPKVVEYLDSLGVDIQKPFETSPLEPDENNMLEYCCCQYIVFGKCDPEYSYKIDDVEFRMATSHPHTGIEKEHFVLELFPIRLKYIH